MSTLLTKKEITELSQIKHGRWATELAIWWLAVVGMIKVTVMTGLTWYLPLLIVLIGCLQNALILWTHEASHCNLFRDKQRNDWVGDLLICGPLGVTVESYRWHHSRHHKYLGDPTQEIELSAFECIRGAQLLVHLARHMFGVIAYRVIFRRQHHSGEQTPFPPPPPRSMPAWIGFLIGNSALFLMCALQGGWWIYFAAWVFPLFTISILVSNFRTIVEHQPSSDVCDSGTSTVPALARIVTANRLERLLIAPIGFYYHYEHHLYPGIPFVNLPEVRRRLQAKGHYDSEPIVYSKGYVKTIWNLAMTKGYGVTFLEPQTGQSD